jgi:hypothetical protein
LSRVSQDSNVKLRDVAQRLIDTGKTPVGSSGGNVGRPGGRQAGGAVLLRPGLQPSGREDDGCPVGLDGLQRAPLQQRRQVSVSRGRGTQSARASTTAIIPASSWSLMWQWNTVRPSKSSKGMRTVVSPPADTRTTSW